MDDEHPNNERRTGQKLIYPELSYKVVGLIYKVNDEIGFGQSEKVYCDALSKLLEKNGVSFKRELYCPIKLDGEVLSKRYFDFVIEGKLILEVKVGDYKYKEACSQLFQYLKVSKMELGIIARFTKNGVKIKRIPCFY